MKPQEVLDLLAATSIVAAIKNKEGLQACLASDAQVVFVLYGSVVDIGEIAAKLQAAGKTAFIHIDLIDGLSPREAAVDFIAANTAAAGILSTKQALIRRAQQNGILAIRRFFLLDSMALQNMYKQLTPPLPDFVEVLPGVMPKTIASICKNVPVPVITGGLIADKEDVMSALSAGALAVSSTNPAVWNL